MNPEPTLSGVEVTLFGPLAASVLRLLDQRYDNVTAVDAPSAGTVVTIADIDQAGERAVLNLLWDTGHQVRSVRRQSQ
ncbi:hypothetical protein ACFWUU_23325 [Kribbella sp. NPDC058693]|uniref:hypothetical protein n=1 Tax=Kribbella sp. NPDC058693 TaxID=3346602 RepID=UPI00366733ED